MEVTSYTKFILSGMACIFLCGCNDLRVSDVNGKPIANAEIWSISASMNVGPSLTNKNGLGNVPANIQGTKWISISKFGYKTVRMDWPQKTPVEVVLINN